MNLIKELHDKIDGEGLWSNTKTLKRNEFLKVKGSIDSKLYYIEIGCLRVSIEDEFQDHTIRFGYQNNFIAALDSFITEGPSEYYIQTIKKTTFKSISKKAFMNFVKSSEDNFNFWHLILEQLIFQQLEREKDILIASPKERYERVLKRSPQLFQEVPNKYIASYLRMTPETLSRVKKS